MKKQIIIFAILFFTVATEFVQKACGTALTVSPLPAMQARNQLGD